jgi:predicted 3-demethylubiquinone-9 3-methyltransferase (glyoxalase superfamily)
MAKIKPCLWFDNQAEDAARLYISLFPDSRITAVQRYSEGGPGEAGSVMVVEFILDGAEFMALNGGPAHFGFTEAVSFYRDCATQEEVDRLWAALTQDGEEGQCGWLKDRFGLSWQIVPRALPEMLADPDPAKATAVMRAMLTMSKIDVPALRKAYDAA